MEISSDSYFLSLPNELQITIFHYLTPKELLVAGLACRHFQSLIIDDSLWKAHYQKKYKYERRDLSWRSSFIFHSKITRLMHQNEPKINFKSYGVPRRAEELKIFKNCALICDSLGNLHTINLS